MKTTHFLDSNNRTGCVIGTIDFLKDIATSFNIEISVDPELENKYPDFYEKMGELEKISDTEFYRTYRGENPFAKDSLVFLIKQFGKGSYIVNLLKGLEFYIDGAKFCEINIFNATDSHILFDLENNPEVEGAARRILEFVNELDAPIEAQLLPAQWRTEWEKGDTRYVFAEHPRAATELRIYRNEEMIYNFDLTDIKGFKVVEDEKTIRLKHRLLTYLYFLYLQLRNFRSDLGMPYPPRKLLFDDRENMQRFAEILQLLSERKTRIVNPI